MLDGSLDLPYLKPCLFQENSQNLPSSKFPVSDFFFSVAVLLLLLGGV
jgi:hypothetical protein